MQTPRQRPATSPYFSKPFIPGAVVGGHLWTMQQNDARSSPAKMRGSSRPGTSSSGRRQASATRWSNPTLGEVIPLFDPNINPFSMRRSDRSITSPLSAREPLQRPGTSSSAKSTVTMSAVTAPATPNRKQKICRPRVWGGGLGTKPPTFDDLHPAEIDRHYHKFTLGPSFGGTRKLRIAPDLLQAEPMNAPGVLEARALSEILEVVQTEEGALDSWWMHPSSRALWYVPRGLSKLHRWECFVEYVCNCDYITEAVLEYGVIEVENTMEQAMQYVVAQRSNTTAFSTLKQKTIDAFCERTIAAYLDFIRTHRRALSATPRKAFQYALNDGLGVVYNDALSQIQALSSQIDEYSKRLPLSDTQHLVQIYRSLDRAREHGLKACLPPKAQELFTTVEEEVKQVVSRLWKSADDGGALEICADRLLGLRNPEGTSPALQKRMTKEGFGDLMLVMSGWPKMSSPSPTEASFVLTVCRPQAFCEETLLQTIAQCASIPQEQVEVVQKRGASVFLRIWAVSQETGTEASLNVIGARDKILMMAGDPASALRKSGLVRGVGHRVGRWENMRIALCNTCDMDYEREYMARFVLPALRAECRKRKIHLTWSDLGSDGVLGTRRVDEGYREAINCMNGLQLCGIRPPGSHKRPFLLALIGTRCGETYQDVVESHVNERPFLRDPRPAARLEWMSSNEHKTYGIPYLQVCDAYLRCVKATESFFILRDSDWLLDQKIVERVPEVVRDQFVETSEQMQQVVVRFKDAIKHTAGPKNRIIPYSATFFNFLSPKSEEDSAETPESVFRTEYQRKRTVTLMNKDFWQVMKDRGEAVLDSCKRFDHYKKGAVTKKELRQALSEHGVMELATDSEMVRLIAAHEIDGRGNVNYAALIRQFVGDGRVRMGGMASLGISTYRRLWSTIDAFFPATVLPGRRLELELNEQELLLDMYATTFCTGVNDHIFGQLKEYAHSDETLDIVALRGSSGSGRSSLLAAFARHCMLQLGYNTDVVYFCLQPWHGKQDILKCLVGQLDSSIVNLAYQEGDPLSGRCLSRALARHAQTRRRDVLIIADGLLSSEIEDQVAFAVKKNNSMGHPNRVRLVFGAVPAERHSASDVLSISILPLMPTEKMKLVEIQESRNRIKLYPEVAVQLCKKPKGGNNTKFLFVAVNFLSKLNDREHMRAMAEMPDNVHDLYKGMVLPFLEKVVGTHTVQHLMGLLFFAHQGGLLRTEIAKLARPNGTDDFMKEHKLYEICESLRFLGIVAVTADEDRFVVSCDEVRMAIHDRYISRHAVLKDCFAKVFKMEKVLRLVNLRSKRNTSEQPSILSANNEQPEGAVFQTDRQASGIKYRSKSVQSGKPLNAPSVINLENQNLTVLPNDILSRGAAPGDVTELWLASNALRGLEAKISLFGSLALLDLSVNSISVLPDHLGSLTNLRSLNVCDNQIKDVPPCLWQLTLLTVLHFGRNLVSRLNDGLGHLTNLQELDFSRNRMLSIPETITKLTALQVLDLSANSLAEITEIVSMTNLRVLHLGNNRLMSVPSLSKALFLEDVNLESNRLDCLPAMMSEYPYLRRLNVADNYIQYLDGYISGSTALESLNACQNELVAVPAEYSNLTNLKTLALANNKLKGLPIELFSLASLITLDISSNQIQEVPGIIEQLTNVQYLFLSENEITALPIELCSMKQIVRLDVDNNPVDIDDPVLKMKREERDKKNEQSPRVARTSSLWDEHQAQMAILKDASSKQDEQRIAQRKIRRGDQSSQALADLADPISNVELEDVATQRRLQPK